MRGVFTSLRHECLQIGSSLGTREKETQTQGSAYEKPGSSADRGSFSLITTRDVRAGGDTGSTDIESTTQSTSPSILPSSREQRLDNSAGTLFTEIADRENESVHHNPVNSADKSSVTLVRVSDGSEGEDSRQNAIDMDQETSQSLIPLS